MTRKLSTPFDHRMRASILARDIVTVLLCAGALVGQVIAWREVQSYVSSNVPSDDLSAQDAARATAFTLRIAGGIWGIAGIAVGLLGVMLAAYPPRRSLLLSLFVIQIVIAVSIMVVWSVRGT